MTPWGKGSGSTFGLPDQREVRRTALEALHELAEQGLAESNKHVPVDTGELRQSGRIVTDPASGRVGIVYTSPHAPYVHEIAGEHHDPGKGPKFLEHALLGLRTRAAEEIARKVRPALH